MGIFEKNLEVLQRYHPELLEQVQAPTSVSHITVTKAKNGDPRLFVRTESGETIPIHNEEDPSKVAQRSAEKIVELGGVLVLMGMGLGYLGKAIAATMNDSSALVVFEADMGIFKTALQLVDLSDLLSHHRVKVLVGEDAQVAECAYYFMVKTGGEVRAVRFEPAFRTAPELYRNKLRYGLVNPTLDNMSNWATADRFGIQFIKNCLESITYSIGTGGMDHLQDQFAGTPAILVAGGPSLSKNVRDLKHAKGKAIIIAADTIFGYLLKCDIVPDFVVTVDPQPATYDKFKGLDIPADCALVFHPMCFDQVPKHFPGAKFVTDTNMEVHRWLGQYWAKKARLDTDVQCQVHMGFNVAQWLGCDPIIMIGQDLCFTEKLMHVKGGGYLPKDVEEDLVTKGPSLTDMFGNSVKTSFLYLRYKTTFEKKIKAFPGTVWNCTEGGLTIHGADNQRLADVLSSACASTQVNVSQVIKGLSHQVPSPQWDALLSEIRSSVKDFFRLRRVSRRLCHMLETIVAQRALSDEIDESLSRLTFRAERLTRLVPKYGKSLSLLQLIDVQLDTYINTFEAEEVDQVEDELERLDKQMARGLRYYRDMGQASDHMYHDLRQLLQRLEQLRHVEQLIEHGPKAHEVLEVVEGFVALELYDRAAEWIPSLLEQAARALQGERAVVVCIENSITLHQMDVAYQSCVMGQQLFPQSTRISTLCEEVRAMQHTWAQWKSEMQVELTQVRPSPLEAGDFYYQVGNLPQAMSQYRHIAEEPHVKDEVRGEAYYRLAKAAQSLGDPEQVVEALEQALLFTPGDSRVYFELGVLALLDQRIDMAEQFFEKGVEISLEDPEYCEAVGAVFAAAGAPQQAIAFYERGLVHHPENPDLLQKISEMYQSLFQPIPSA